MKPTIKNLKTKFLYIILPTILVLTLVILLFRTYQKTQILITGIRPFSELLATDFADVKDEVADPSKCDGSKVIEQIKKSSTNPNLADKWEDYEPNIHKLTILDDCWRQYENEYVRFKFRDLNGSLRMDRTNRFSIKDTYGNLSRDINFGAYKNDKRGKDYYEAVSNLIQVIDVSRESHLKNPLSVKLYKNPQGLVILRTEVISTEGVLIKKIYYTIDVPGTDRYISISAGPNLVPFATSARIVKDILSTIEIKK